MSAMAQRIDALGQLDAVLIHADGSRESIGTLAKDKLAGFARRLYRSFKSAVKSYGLLAAMLMYAGLVHSGRLPWQTLPLLQHFALVTTAGVNYMAADFASGGTTPTISGNKFHDSGTGATAAAIGDTALQTATGNARVSGTASNPSANIYQTVATLAYTGTAAITEWGLFSASTSGTLWDHRVFSAINVINGDSIQFTYKLTIASGGT